MKMEELFMVMCLCGPSFKRASEASGAHNGGLKAAVQLPCSTTSIARRPLELNCFALLQFCFHRASSLDTHNSE